MIMQTRKSSRKTSTANLVLATLAALSLTTACGLRGDPFMEALKKTEQNSKLNVPGKKDDGQALTEGELAPYYQATYNLSRFINGGVGLVFLTIGAITSKPATTREENKRIWGPSEPEGLERISWRFTVERDQPDTNPDHYIFQLEGREKGSDVEEDFKKIYDGEVELNEDLKALGSIKVDFDAHRELKPDACEEGAIVIDFDGQAEPRQLTVSFMQTANTCVNEVPKDATYQYTEAEDASGTLLFYYDANMHVLQPVAKGELETFTIHSQWLADGTGRSDVRIEGGEIPGDLSAAGLAEDHVAATECWDELFGLTYADTSPEELREASGNADCDDQGNCQAVGTPENCAIAEGETPDAI
jgi:hypothetical protein